jgi:acyl-[acyl-carrier-protein]-phospholipid O-acyltransferase/long-chain-fatty-acid--[acyl-carrier-protein] ligase
MTVFPPVDLAEKVKSTGNRRDFRRKMTEAIYDILNDCFCKSRNVDMNIFRALEKAVRRFGSGRPILEDYKRVVMTYGQLLRASKVLGRYLTSLPDLGRNVGIMLPNSNPLAVLVFGLWAGAKVPVMLNYSQGRRNVGLAVEAAGLSTIITSRAFIESGKFEKLLDDLPAKILYLEDLKLSILDKLKGLLWRPKPASPDSPGVILFTSGSEGIPKGVVLSHKNMISDSVQARTLVEIHEDDVLFNPMPAFHAFGLNVGLVLPLILGLRLYLHVSPLQLKAIPELIYDTKSTVLISSDSFAAAWAQSAHQYDFHHVRLIMVGAEKLKESTVDLYFKKFGIKLFEGYGVTEGSPILAVNSHMRNRYGSVGHIIPGLRWKIEPVPGLDRGGRFMVKGPNIMLGYLDKDKPGEVELLGEQWYDTGDIAELDDDGFLWIIGRYRRFSKISGEMISLTAIEEVAQKVWPDSPLAVLALPDPNKGERLVLVHTESELELPTLRRALTSAGFTELFCPRSTMTVPEIPLTPLGKVNVPVLTEMVTEILAKNT